VKGLNDAYTRSRTEIRLGSSLLKQLERLEELDRISPRARLESGVSVCGVDFEIIVKVKGRKA
jgi:hypothetical protein